MVEGIILDSGEKGYSYFGKIFNEITILSENYNWLISYPECYPTKVKLKDMEIKEYIWLSGVELKRMLQFEDFQWIWGVFSGFPKNITLENVLKFPIPYADGNDVFWKNPITLQHPLSEIELVAWDSSCTLFISQNDSVIEKILTVYKHAKDLEKYNNR